MVDKHQTTSTQAIRLYRDLADWYPLLTPVGDYYVSSKIFLFFDRVMDSAGCKLGSYCFLPQSSERQNA